MNKLIILLLLITTSFSQTYNRDEFGDWSNKTSMTTRDMIIYNNLTSKKVICYYCGDTIESSKCDIDHVVPVKWAYIHGGSLWTPSLKNAFFNDKTNLVTSCQKCNRSKQDKDYTQWLPKYHIDEYKTIWTLIKAKYKL